VASTARPAVPVGTAAIPRFCGLRGGKRHGEDGRNHGRGTEASLSHFEISFLST
jgi:hypothetical protein